jgi:energy-coupling factor transporter ATP-binding protein EcfA2
VKLHRLVLTNYRGITHRDIEFPDNGVVVVCGANEIGKSSMIEALDLLLESKDRSTKKEVKQVKPTHADVGAEITAEISTGPYRFVYRKRFHKRTETALTVLAPCREQLTGDEAHDRVRAILDETVDVQLWQAQRVLQSTSTAAVDLSGCDALSRALDVAAGEAVQLSGAEPLLIDRIDAEYLRYFTPTGRPTGEWANTNKRMRDADDEVARCAAAVAEVDDAVRTHATLTAELERLSGECAEAAKQLATARTAAEEVAVLRQQLKQAEVVATAADATLEASLSALTERRRLAADVTDRAGAVAELEKAAARAHEDELTAREVQEAAEAAADEARVAVQRSQARVEAARRALDRQSDRDEAQRLSSRLARIDAALAELGDAERELAPIALTDALMRDIETAASAVERAAGQAELASAHIELVAARDIELLVGGEPVRFTAGGAWSTNATTTTEIDVPGVLTARIVPGAPASDTQAELDAAQQVLERALSAAKADDVAGARVLDQRRRELVAGRDRSTATVDGLLGDDDVEALRARLAELSDTANPDTAEATGPADSASARTELTEATAEHQKAIAECETHRKVAEVAAKRLGEKATQASVAQEKLTACLAELTVGRDRLAHQRATVTDDELLVKAEADKEKARRATGLVADLGGELTRCAPGAVAAALDEAMRHVDALSDRHDGTSDALRLVTAQLKVYGTEGRKCRLDAAETEREHAEAEYLRVHRRARAAELLRSVMARHRDATRLRYVDPFRGQVERLGRIVFGETFEVEIDSQLRICSRTLSGRTVPYESLSGGAKEQLGIVARLAGAALVAKEDSVPVVIDDALGFTDPVRLVKMGAVFDAVGGDGQVIVLTCSPQRYQNVGAAHHIELSA